MTYINDSSMRRAAECVRAGGVCVIPTDTLYGLIAPTFDPLAVERVYDLKKRDAEKPCVILLSDLSELGRFEIEVSDSTYRFLSALWPAPVSVILPAHNPDLAYLHRGTNSFAFRIPDDEELRTLLEQTGPLIAPSANPQSQPPATTVGEARDYFGYRINCYIDGGIRDTLASTIVDMTGDSLKIVREGSYTEKDVIKTWGKTKNHVE